MLKEYGAKDNKRILCYLRGKHNFELFYQIFLQNPNITFVIHSNFISEDDFRRSIVFPLKNVIFAKNIKNLLYKINSFGCFITTDAQATESHSYSLKIIALCNKINIPVLEIQHGLFQLGVHYYHEAQGCNFYNDSIPTTGYSRHFLSYYDIENTAYNAYTIGYPPFSGESTKTYDGEYSLILSNLHWETYSEEERYLFYSSIFRLAEDNQDKLFIWKMHHGEHINNNCLKMINDLENMFPYSKSNLSFTNKSNFLNKLSTSELIKKSRNVISTISTVLLDCEIFSKNTAIYHCKSIEALSNKLQDKHTFRNYKELHNIFTNNSFKMKTGLLEIYNNHSFLNTIDKLYSLPSLNQDVLNQVIETINLN